jgi:8-oxo-dGTP diphosphatase
LAAIFERVMTDSRGHPEYHYVLVDFVCRTARGTPVPGDDVSAVEWVPKRRLSQYRLTEGTLGVIRRAFAARARRSARVVISGAIGPLPPD